MKALLSLQESSVEENPKKEDSSLKEDSTEQ